MAHRLVMLFVNDYRDNNGDKLYRTARRLDGTTDDHDSGTPSVVAPRDNRLSIHEHAPYPRNGRETQDPRTAMDRDCPLGQHNGLPALDSLFAEPRTVLISGSPFAREMCQMATFRTRNVLGRYPTDASG